MGNSHKNSVEEEFKESAPGNLEKYLKKFPSEYIYPNKIEDSDSKHMSSVEQDEEVLGVEEEHEKK